MRRLVQFIDELLIEARFINSLLNQCNGDLNFFLIIKTNAQKYYDINNNYTK